MPNQVIVDLKNCGTEEEVLSRFGDVFQFGGPDGNFHCGPGIEGGWGMNWDAFADSLSEVGNGGIWGTSPKIEFPVEIVVKNYDQFRQNDPDGFDILISILNGRGVFMGMQGKVMAVRFEG